MIGEFGRVHVATHGSRVRVSPFSSLIDQRAYLGLSGRMFAPYVRQLFLPEGAPRRPSPANPALPYGEVI